MLSMLYVRLKIKVKVGIPESFKIGWYPHKITGLSHLRPDVVFAKSLKAYLEYESLYQSGVMIFFVSN